MRYLRETVRNGRPPSPPKQGRNSPHRRVFNLGGFSWRSSCWRTKLRFVPPSHFLTLFASYSFDIIGSACGGKNPRAPFVEFAWRQVIRGAEKDVSLPLGPRGDVSVDQ